MEFDPFGRLARRVSEELLHRLIRFGMVALLIVFLVRRITEYPAYAVKALWFLETLLFAVLITAFLFRTVPLDRARGVREILLPLAGSALPFVLLLSPPATFVVGHPSILCALLWEMTAATTLTVAGMWQLRRAFSITIEARELVTGGPYRLVRHPIYLGEMLAAAGVTAIRLCAANLLILLLFVALQLLRARGEEEKLARTFPSYRAYAVRSRWFW